MPKNSKLLEEFLKMQGTSLMLTISLVSILSVALLTAVPNQAFAQQVDFEYRCYNTDGNTSPTSSSELLTLEDQFRTQVYTLGPSLELCNPALKSPEASIDVDPLIDLPHLRCWSITEIDGQNDPLNIIVLLNDQFSEFDIQHTVLEPVEFCHTTAKTSGTLDGTNIAYDPSNGGIQVGLENIANWVCYNIDQKNIPDQPFRRLKDQFTVTNAPEFPDGIEIGQAQYLCAPAKKTYFNEEFVPGLPKFGPPGCAAGGLCNPNNLPGTVKVLDEHMKCYDIVKEGTVNENNPGPSGLTGVAAFTPSETIILTDQFSEQSDVITALDKICLDVIKKVNIAGTFIPLDSVAILLAGSQMTAAWILPALVASAGVGYGIEIARKYHKDTK